jgi:hypothetical protein
VYNKTVFTTVTKREVGIFGSAGLFKPGLMLARIASAFLANYSY